MPTLACLPPLRIRNWKKFQHFKDRRPPWIKLYRDLLDSHDWHLLDSENSKALVMLWLLAAETDDGSLPTIPVIAFRLRTTETRIKSILTKLAPWLEQPVIIPISPRYQDGPSETETETETETYKERHIVKEETDNTSPLDKGGDAPPIDSPWGTPEALVALYNSETPDELPAVTRMSPARTKKAKLYLSMFPDQQFWKDLCTIIHRSAFLRGLTSTNGRSSFKADFDWLLSKGKDGSENCLKVYEGRYTDERRG